jgi:hypothetical protein
MSRENVGNLPHDSRNILNSLMLSLCIHHRKDVIKGRINFQVIERWLCVERFRWGYRHWNRTFRDHSLLMIVNHFLELFVFLLVILVYHFLLNVFGRFLYNRIFILLFLDYYISFLYLFSFRVAYTLPDLLL